MRILQLGDHLKLQQMPCQSCGKLIIWTVSARGDRLPLDAEPLSVGSVDGNVRITSRGPGFAPMATVIRHQGQLFGAKAVYRQHSKVCPGTAGSKGGRRR